MPDEIINLINGYIVAPDEGVWCKLLTFSQEFGEVLLRYKVITPIEFDLMYDYKRVVNYNLELRYKVLVVWLSHSKKVKEIRKR